MKEIDEKNPLGCPTLGQARPSSMTNAILFHFFKGGNLENSKLTAFLNLKEASLVNTKRRF